MVQCCVVDGGGVDALGILGELCVLRAHRGRVVDRHDLLSGRRCERRRFLPQINLLHPKFYPMRLLTI